MVGDRVILQTERLRLRRARADDLAAMHSILSNQDATQYWSSAPHSCLAQTAEWLAKVIESSADDSNEFVVELDGRVIGKAGCWRVPEVGFIFHPNYWGRGLASEALQAVIDSTFAKFPTPELTADVDPRNGPCLRLLSKLGFCETGRAADTWLVNGRWTDSVYLSLARSNVCRGAT